MDTKEPKELLDKVADSQQSVEENEEQTHTPVDATPEEQAELEHLQEKPKCPKCETILDKHALRFKPLKKKKVYVNMPVEDKEETPEEIPEDDSSEPTSVEHKERAFVKQLCAPVAAKCKKCGQDMGIAGYQPMPESLFKIPDIPPKNKKTKRVGKRKSQKMQRRRNR